MWNKPAEVEAPSNRTAQPSSFSTTPSITSATSPAVARPSVPTARNMSCLGAGIEIKGSISGSEDLQIDGKVEGPVDLHGQKLTIGHTGKVNSGINARDVVVYGEITGNLHAQDRVEIKKDASVIGDIKATRISIEDGAYCKGHIEIERGRSHSAAAPEPESVVNALVPVGAN